MPRADKPRLLIVTGMSGAGKSTVLDALEDMGWDCVDNLPTGLLHDFVAAEHPSLATLPFPERVTADVMVTFADELGEDCSEGTICDYLVEICRFAQACDPKVCLRSIKLEARRYGRRRNRRKKAFERRRAPPVVAHRREIGRDRERHREQQHRR